VPTQTRRAGEAFSAAWFGGLRLSTGSLPTDRLFTGQTRDLNNDAFYWFRARYLDTTIGKFHTPDAVVPDPGNPQALNRYSYVMNMILRFVDPSGHMLSTGDTPGGDEYSGMPTSDIGTSTDTSGDPTAVTWDTLAGQGGDAPASVSEPATTGYASPDTSRLENGGGYDPGAAHPGPLGLPALHRPPGGEMMPDYYPPGASSQPGTADLSGAGLAPSASRILKGGVDIAAFLDYADYYFACQSLSHNVHPGPSLPLLVLMQMSALGADVSIDTLKNRYFGHEDPNDEGVIGPVLPRETGITYSVYLPGVRESGRTVDLWPITRGRLPNEAGGGGAYANLNGPDVVVDPYLGGR
jgi:RHS repeat-associated protein